jgi:uncharacterized membrane protein
MPIKYRIIFFTLILIGVLFIFVEPLSAIAEDFIYALPFAQIIFSNVCHQNPDKLLHVGEYATMVCARCAGIYIGALFSSAALLLFYRLKVKSVKYLLYSFVPALIDVLLVNLGVYEYNKPAAFISGLILGSSVFYYFYKAISSQYYGKN